MDAVHWTLQKIYQCKMSSLPPAMLVHKFWRKFQTEMPTVPRYVSCLLQHGVDPDVALKQCQNSIRGRCGSVFGARLDTHRECMHWLWGTGLSIDNYQPNSVRYRNKANRDFPPEFQEYYRCLSSLDQIARSCAESHLDRPCRKRSTRVIKTVRVNMDEAEYMLKSFPQFRLLHLMRDPRAVLFSRNQVKWSRGLFSKNDLAREARLFCDQIHRDELLRRQFQSRYATRLMRVIYEDFLEQPLFFLEKIHAFAGGIRPSDVVQQLYRLRTNAARANKWKKSFGVGRKSTVIGACKDLFNLVHEFVVLG